MIRIGIVGTGSAIGIAKRHIDAFERLPDASVAALYDIIPEKANDYQAALELKNAKVCTSYDELLSFVDAVVICTPNSTHVDLAVKALKEGKHVLCEKPFSVNAATCGQALEYAALSQRVCMIGLCYRGMPGYKCLKNIIDKGELGDIYYMRMTLGGNRIANPDVKREWRMNRQLSGPGAIADFGSHMLDIADWLLRDHSGPIRQLQSLKNTFIHDRNGYDGRLQAVDNDDVAIFHAKCEKGVLINFTASRIGGSHGLEVYGSGGYAFFSGAEPFKLMIQRKAPECGYDKEAETLTIPEELYAVDGYAPKTAFHLSFYLQAREFINAIKNHQAVETDFQRGLYIQKLIDDVNRSAENEKLVYIDYD